MGLILSLFVSAVLGVLYSLAAYWAIRSRRVSQAHRLKRLSQSAIFRSSWKMGLALFGMNGVFFFGTIAACHIGKQRNNRLVQGTLTDCADCSAGNCRQSTVMAMVWEHLQGDWKGRGIAAFLGSRFYLLLFAYSIYSLRTLRPAFPGDDPFMTAIGLTLLLIVSAAAGVTGLLTVGWPRRRNAKS